MLSFTCNLCPRRCGVQRTETSGNGICHMPASPVVARAALHFGEEPCISGTAQPDKSRPVGSGTVFFSGCPLGCRFCQNRVISHEGFGKPITVQRLAAIFCELEQQGARNINLVNPTHFVPSILRALDLYKPSIPVVYNTSGYERVETLKSLQGAVDVYLPDLKYIHADLSSALSGAPDYFTYASQAILEMARQTGPMVLDADGMAVKGTLVRHLVLPGHTKESLAVLDWLKAHLPEGTWVSLMFQYTPMAPIEGHPELHRRLTARECRKVWDYMVELGITDGYVQQRKSAGKGFIPSFDLTGI